MTPPKKKNNAFFYNILFIAFSLGLIYFLWNAPPETTTKLPHDEIHQKFHAMEKKEAEKFCESCHNPKGVAPLPKDHPPKYRCLFCHKK